MKTRNLLILIVLVLLLLQFCGGDKFKDLYESQKAKVEDVEKLRLKEADSLRLVIAQSERENEELKKSVDSLQSLKVVVRNRPKKQPKNLDELEQYFEERYQEDVTTLDGRIALQESTAKLVVNDLEQFDIEREINEFNEMIISFQKTKLDNLEADKKNLSFMLLSAENEIDERKKLQKIAEKRIQNLQRKSKLTNFERILIGGAGITTGVLIGRNLR